MITEIRLQRFKAFKDTEPLPLARVNLLTGMNGRGKSSLMQALLLMAQSMDNEGAVDLLELQGRYVRLGHFDDVMRKNIEPKTFSFSFKTDDEVDNDIYFEFEQMPGRSLYAQIGNLIVNGKSKMETVIVPAVRIAINCQVRVVGNNNVRIANKAVKRVGETSDILGLSQLKNIFFISADRQGAVDSVVDNDAWNIRKGAGVHGEYVLNMLDAATAEQTEKINRLIAKIMGSGHVSTEKNPTTKEINLYIDPSGKSKGFHPSNVGFGYSYLLSILTTMVMAPAGSKIFIENPEAHLNPKAQAVLTEEIIRMACENNFQIFVESHSDHVLHRCQISVLQRKINKEDLSVLFFDFSDDEPNLSTVRKLEVTDSGHIRRPPEGFFDQAEKDLAVLIGL